MTVESIVLSFTCCACRSKFLVGRRTWTCGRMELITDIINAWIIPVERCVYSTTVKMYTTLLLACMHCCCCCCTVPVCSICCTTVQCTVRCLQSVLLRSASHSMHSSGLCISVPRYSTNITFICSPRDSRLHCVCVCVLGCVLPQATSSGLVRDVN